MIDQIKAEIQRWKKHYEEAAREFGDEGYQDNVLIEQGKQQVCEKLLSFIDSLLSCPQESDTCEDLEKEAEAYWKAQGGGSHAQWDKFRAVVKHFTEWQKEQDLKDAVEGKVIAGKDGSQYIQTICVDIKESLPNKVKLKIIKDDDKI